MWEMTIVILTVLAAATGVGYGLWHNASGKASCAICSGCDQLSCSKPAGPRDIAYDAENK